MKYETCLKVTSVAKHLNDKDIELVIRLVDGWEGKLTWEALCDQIKNDLGFRPTRQTLNAHLRIKNAFVAKKGQQKSGLLPTQRPQSLDIAQKRINRLEKENERLKTENERLLERFIRWQYNAQKRGLSQSALDELLLAINRDSSEKLR